MKSSCKRLKMMSKHQDKSSNLLDSNMTTIEDVEIVLQPVNPYLVLPLVDSGRRYLKVPENCTVSHLAKYLELQHKINTPTSEVTLTQRKYTFPFTFYIQIEPDNFEPLHGYKTLPQVLERCVNKDPTLPLDLFFTYNLDLYK